MTTFGTFDDVPLARGADIELAAEQKIKDLRAIRRDVELFSETIKKYLLWSATPAGEPCDADVWADLDVAFRALDRAFQRVGRLQ